MFSKLNKQFFRIINLSADSFSGDAFADVDKALAAARAFPCDVLDIGAVSTRPGASSIESSHEIQILGKFFDKYDLDQDLSLDSHNPLVIKYFIDHPKLVYINDVTGMQNPEILKILAPTNLKLISMHSKGGIPPSLKSSEISDEFYQEDGGLFEHMKCFWNKTIKLCESYNISKERLILDPGLGFGKNLKQSLEIVNLAPKIKQEFGLPLMIGASRKSFLKLWKPLESHNNKALDLLTAEYNALFEDVFFRVHIPAKI